MLIAVMSVDMSVIVWICCILISIEAFEGISLLKMNKFYYILFCNKAVNEWLNCNSENFSRSTDRLPSVLPTLQEDYESEKMGQSIPLIIPETSLGGGIRRNKRNATRRMSVPAVCLTNILNQGAAQSHFPIL